MNRFLIYIRPIFNSIIEMKKMIFGALALAMFTVTSCRNENTETTEETVNETAINEEVTPEMTTEEVEDSLEVETETAVDSLDTTTETEQEVPAVQ